MSASALNNGSRVRRTTFYTQRRPQAMVRRAISLVYASISNWFHSVALDELDDCMLVTSVSPTKAKSLDVPVQARTKEIPMQTGRRTKPAVDHRFTRG